MNRSKLRAWITDALARHERDTTERHEELHHATVEEILDSVWGRLPLKVRRETSRAQVQASLAMTTLRQHISTGHQRPSRATVPPSIES